MAHMTLGDFFQTGPRMRPVNPQPVSFTCGTSEKVLPGGQTNDTGRQVLAKVTGALTFLDTDRVVATREEAKADIAERGLLGLTESELEFEVRVYLLQKIVRSYDALAMTAGEPLFPTAKLVRQLLVPREVHRLWDAYQEYVKVEHPEVVDTETFRAPASGGPRLSVGAPGR